MSAIKTVFVTGATGNQGGSVARSLSSKGFHVRALARDPLSLAAQALKEYNIEVVKGDLNDVNSFKDYIKEMDAVYSVQTYKHGIKKEIAQGKLLADIARENSVSHFVYSSVIGADLATGIPHWESKSIVEKHLMQSGIPYTVIRPTSFYQNFLIPQVRSRILKGKLVVPLNRKCIQQFMSAEDVGPVVTNILQNPSPFNSQIITLGAEQLDQDQVANAFSKVLGKEIIYQRLPSLITRLALGSDLSKMFRWVDKNNGIFIDDLDALHQTFPGMEKLEHWISRKFPKA